MTRALFVLLVTALPAVADEVPRAAIDAYERGRAAFAHGEFAVALVEFQRAQSIAPSPNLAYNLGATYERLELWEEAARELELWLTLCPEEDPGLRAQVEQRIAADRQHAPVVIVPYDEPQATPPRYNYAMRVERDPQAKIDRAHAQRKRAIALTIVGVTMAVGGLAAAIDSITDAYYSHTYYDQFWLSKGEYVVDNVDRGFNFSTRDSIEIFFGVTGAATGLALTGSFGRSWSQSERVIHTLEEAPRHELPAAMTLQAPPIVF